MCRKLGATHVVNTRNTDSARSEILQITGGKKVDVSIELSGAPQLFKTCIEVTKPKGIISMLAFYDAKIEFDLNDIILGGITIKTAGGGWGYFPQTLDLMADGRLDLTPLITSRITLDEVPEQILNLKQDNTEKIKVMMQIL